VRRFATRSKAPIGLAAFLALPVFFASLMAATLAIEKARVVEWSRPGGHLARTWHNPTGSTEAKIWLQCQRPSRVSLSYWDEQRPDSVLRTVDTGAPELGWVAALTGSGAVL